jgi:meiotic recombination protein REC8, fungi type
MGINLSNEDDDDGDTALSAAAAAAIDTESINFLEFIRLRIDEHDEDVSSGITFEEMLPPGQFGCVVAAQAFLHVLALASRGLVRVKQEIAFGEVTIVANAAGE